MSNNEFIARKGLVIKSVLSGNTETDVLIKDADGLVKYNSISNLLPKIGKEFEIIFRDTGVTYGYNTSSGFTYNTATDYLKLGNIPEASMRIHIYGEDTGSYVNEVDVSPDSAIFLDGLSTSDKSLVFGENGVKQWAFQTYRDEVGQYVYITDLETNLLNQVWSRSGRSGINKQSNVLNYHSQYQDEINGQLNDMNVGGWYDRLYQALYEIEVHVIGTPDLFHWRKSRDNGNTWTGWSSNIPVSTGLTDIEYHVQVYWDNDTGHNTFDRWRFTAFPQLPQGNLTVAGNGYTEINTTEDFTQPIPVRDDVTNDLSTTFSGFKTCLSGLTSAIYVGWRLPFNSIYFNHGETASGVTLKFEYYSPSGWTEILITEGYGSLQDFTNNLEIDGKVEWDRNELNWVLYQMPGEDTGYN